MKIPRNKVLLAAAVIFIAAGVISCEKIKDAAQFDLLYEVPEATIGLDSTLIEVADNEQVMVQKEIYISLDSIRRKHDLDSFEEAKFDYIRIEVVTPASADLKFISKLKATVMAPGIAETEVASYTGNGTAGKTIDMVLEDSPITPFLMNERFTLRVYARFAPPLPASTVTVKLNSRIRITVQPL